MMVPKTPLQLPDQPRAPLVSTRFAANSFPVSTGQPPGTRQRTPRLSYWVPGQYDIQYSIRTHAVGWVPSSLSRPSLARAKTQTKHSNHMVQGLVKTNHSSSQTMYYAVGRQASPIQYIRGHLECPNSGPPPSALFIQNVTQSTWMRGQYSPSWPLVFGATKQTMPCQICMHVFH